MFLIKFENLCHALVQQMVVLLCTSTVSNCWRSEKSCGLGNMPTRSLNKQLQNLRDICTAPRGLMIPQLVREKWAGSPQEDKYWGDLRTSDCKGARS